MSHAGAAGLPEPGPYLPGLSEEGEGVTPLWVSAGEWRRGGRRRIRGPRAARPIGIYRECVSSSSLTPEEIRAAAETHQELGRDYSSAVIESFLDKVGREIDARVDARLSQHAPWSQAVPQKRQRQASPTLMGIISLVLGIPITAIVAYSPAHLPGLLVVWIAIAVINVAYAVRPHNNR